MKKNMILPAMLLAASLILGGCGSAGNQQNPDDPMAPRTYQIASGSSSGDYYLQITPIAALWENLDFITSCRVQSSSGGLENTVVISNGMADAGLLDSFAYFAALNGSEPYTKSYGGFSAIASGSPVLATIVVRADSEIQSIQDLKGHAIALGLAGSGAEFEERFLLEALGITYDDFTQVSQIGIGPGFTDFQDGKVDAVFAMMGPGNSNLMEAMTNVDVRILPLSADDIQTITQNCQWAAEDVIPGGSYMGIDEDILTISVPTLLMVSDQVPEEAVYQMTEMVYDNIDSLISSNKNFGQWTFGISCGGNIPLHPGAEAFYEDRGLE